MIAVLRMLRAFSLPYVAAHPVRVILTALGVSLGVATFVAVETVADGLVEAFTTSVRTVAGESELEVSGHGGGLPETAIARVAAVPGVEAAAGLVEAFVPLAMDTAETAYLIGVDFLASPVWRAQFPREAIEIADELVFVSRPDSVVVTRAFAERRGLALDDPLEIATPAGRRVLRVRGLMADVAASRLFGGAVLLMDLPAALRQLGRDTIDRVLVDLADETDVDATRAALGDALGDGVDVASPESRGARVDVLLSSLRAMLETAGFTAGIVGGFVVFHAVAVAIRQRRRQLALAHAVGISPRTLRTVCLLESAGIALGGVVVGVWLGGWLARAVGGVVATAASDIWVRVDAMPHAPRLSVVLVGAAIGVGATLIATVVALRVAFGVPTIEALRGDEGSADDRPLRRRGLAVGLALIAATALLGLVPPDAGRIALVVASDVVNVLAIGGASLLAPAAVVGIGALVNRLSRRSRSTAVRLAAAGVPRRPWSGGATVATIVAATSVTVTLAVLVQSFQGAWVDWLEQHFGADLFVGAGGRVRLMAGPPMDRALGDALRTVPGIETVEPFRVVSITVRDHPVFLQAVAIADRLEHGGFAMVEGSAADAAGDLEAGTAVLVSDNLAYRLGLRTGDRIDLPTPQGVHATRIAGTYTDYLGSLDLGAIVVSSTFFRRTWHDESANLFRLWTVPGAPLADVRAAVTARLPAGGGHFVLSGREFVGAIRDVLQTFFAAGWTLQLVAALAGVIGILNAQVIAVLDRTRELATLRTIGIPPGSVGRSVMLECGVLGATGGVLGTMLGLWLAVLLLQFTMRLLTGWRLPMYVPLDQLAGGTVLAATIAALAGGVPARLARRVSTGSRSVD